jgi:hypothetical protein
MLRSSPELSRRQGLESNGPRLVLLDLFLLYSQLPWRMDRWCSFEGVPYEVIKQGKAFEDRPLQTTEVFCCLSISLPICWESRLSDRPRLVIA